jgi:hypothetical protein
MQDPNQVIHILQIVAPSVISIVFIVAAAAVADSWMGKRAKRLAPQDVAAQARIEERLNQLTTAVDAIAVEVERISEGQRFTTKLLADNAATSGVQAISERAGTSP